MSDDVSYEEALETAKRMLERYEKYVEPEWSGFRDEALEVAEAYVALYAQLSPEQT